MYFFFTDTATTEIYTLSLHDALPISRPGASSSWTARSPRAPRASSATTSRASPRSGRNRWRPPAGGWGWRSRSEEHTSELQSRRDLVCRLLLEKKKKKKKRQKRGVEK